MNCPACTAKRLHEPSDWALHPYAGHGYQDNQGWTHPDLDPAKPAGSASGFRLPTGSVMVASAFIFGDLSAKNLWEGRV